LNFFEAWVRLIREQEAESEGGLQAPPSLKVSVELAPIGNERLELHVKGDAHGDTPQRETDVTDRALEESDGAFLCGRASMNACAQCCANACVSLKPRTHHEAVAAG
jgi:hypothetical protein